MRELLRLLPLVRKQLLRQPLRSGLTLSGVAVAMFLFCTVEAMRTGVEHATEVTAEDTVLVVYRENRYCPFTSRLPQYYTDRIEAIDGVESAIPMKIDVSNCRASLDVVTFRGAPVEEFITHLVPGFTITGIGSGASKDSRCRRRRGSAVSWARRKAESRSVEQSMRMTSGLGTFFLAGTSLGD